MLYCKNCGTEFVEGTKFCPSCGKPLNEAPESTGAQEASAQEPAKPKSKKTGAITTIIAIIVLAVAGYIYYTQDMGGDLSSLTSAKTYTVKYEIKGSASEVDITYTNAEGGTAQESGVKLPWTYTFNGKAGDFVYISAQNQGSYGSVTVTIYKDNTNFKSTTSSGEYVIASADGSL